ncbi:cytochrome c551 [Neobacillus massiliamazoniensis]|uniref:Cytochrome c class I n=1 Tax=Neobacillus massiliamazoniensis TaxID=1499688 RepID=A0A0U1NUG6_9BACI|nr:cytochrome c [Neobacillus massiliamazoniensis]CRK81402.1 cytochrome c class I [Neobacillus massiliamazoniensis]
MRKKLLALLMGPTLVMGLAACGGGTDTSKGSDSAAGGDAQKIYSQKCSSCHGDNLEGKVGPKLASIGKNLDKQQILDIIKNGKPGGMPAGLISGDDADKVATWLASKK